MKASRRLRERGRFVRNVERDILGRMVAEVLPALTQSIGRMREIQSIQNDRLWKMHQPSDPSLTTDSRPLGAGEMEGQS